MFHPYKLASRRYKPEDTIIKIKNVQIGGETIQIAAGPCAVENRESIMTAAIDLKARGINILRAGAFKPRTNPYTFRGLGEEGLKYLKEAADDTHMLIITEVMDSSQVGLVSEYADILQIGARNMYNYSLLTEVSKLQKTVLLKRGFSATIEEWLMASEYILSGGNPNVILCERGIRTFETHTRNTLDLTAVAAAKYLTHLPVLVDPSHGTGKWRYVLPMSRAAVAAGADGLLIEVHPCPSEALSDGSQSLTYEKFDEVLRDIEKIAKALGKRVGGGVLEYIR